MADAGGIIGRGIRIKGDVSGAGSLIIEGEVEGRVQLNQLTVHQAGVINAEVEVDEATIHGRAAGNIDASQRVEVKSSATVLAEIRAPSIVIEEGAVLRGSVQMDTGIPDDL